jgi:hypothetical protein
VVGAVRLLRDLLVDGLNAALQICDIEAFGGRGHRNTSPRVFKRLLEN